MKKILSVVLAVMMVCSIASFAVSAEDKITVTLNGTEIVFADQAPTIVDGRTLVPLRAIFEALGASVNWNGETRTVTSAKGDTAISLTIDTPTLIVNGEAKTLDVPAMIINGRTMVPARAVAEAYGVEVAWDGETRTVILTTPAASDEAPVDGVVVFSEAFATGCETLQEVQDPENPSNTVYFMESNAGEQESWTYFWLPANYVAGKRYIAEYDVYLATDVFGNDITDAAPSVGTCMQYGDYACSMHPDNVDGKSMHHGNTSDGKTTRYDVTPKTWQHIALVFDIPETINPDEITRFGVFGNPVEAAGYGNKISVNFYLDNVSVKEYTGDAGTGFLDVDYSDHVAPAKPAVVMPAGLTIDNAEGIVYEMNEESTLSPSNTHKYENGLLIFDSTGDNDPRIADAGVKFEAAEYCGVIAKVKYENFVSEDPAVFGVYYATVDDPELTQSKYADAKYANYTPDADGWYTIYVDLTTKENWTGTIDTIRFDPINGEGIITIDKIVVVKK